jgi:RNA polymerase sigma factor (sigma-70 family)
MLVVIAGAMSRSLRQHCSPEDIWQETLAHAWRDRAQHRWQHERAFRAWLFEIARNRIRETARRIASEKRGAGHAERRASDLSVSIGSGLHPADSISPSRVFFRGERKEAVLQALSELPPDLHEVLRMHLLDGLTMEAVAERLGIGLSAAWHRFRKGSEMCARSLSDWAGDGSSGAV